MYKFFKNTGDLFLKVYTLARPYGRNKLITVLGISFAQGLFQVLGVTSIFPFLALAADTSRLRDSEFGGKLLELLPPMDDGRLLLVSGVFAVVMLFLSNGVNLAAEFVRNRYVQHFGHWLRMGLLRKIAMRPYVDFLQENSGVLTKKVVADVTGYTTGVLLPLLDCLARLATIVLLVGTLFLVHPQMATASALGLGLFYVVIFLSLGRIRERISNGLKDALRGTHAEVHQMLGGIKPVKVHCAEENFLFRFSNYSARRARLEAWAVIMGQGPRYLVEPLAFGGLVVVVLIYAARGQDLIAILPNLGVMALAGYRLLPALQLFYAQITKLTTQRHALEEVLDEFLAAEKTATRDGESTGGRLTSPAPKRWQRAITIENLSFSYPGSTKPVIQNLNLSIPKNSSLGILGTTGSGKSTLVDLILGLHDPTSGRILIDDSPLGPENRRAWHQAIGYVPQEIFLLDDTVASNIAFGVPKAQIKIADLERAATAAQILDFVMTDLPLGWDTVVGERGVRLSGGQRQRIGLARALYHMPDLLILDEATSALDLTTEKEVMKAIQNLQGQVTMLIIAHRTDTIASCDSRLELSITVTA